MVILLDIKLELDQSDNKSQRYFIENYILNVFLILPLERIIAAGKMENSNLNMKQQQYQYQVFSVFASRLPSDFLLKVSKRISYMKKKLRMTRFQMFRTLSFN